MGNIDVNSGAVVSNNTAGVDGGGIWSDPNNVIIDSSTVTGNEANHNGGGVFISGSPEENGSLFVNLSTFTFNRALNEGGAIFASVIEAVTVNNSTFTSNTADQNGGAIATHDVENVAITGSSITASIFTNNTATSGRGGAIYTVGNTDIYIFMTGFYGNTAGIAGGAIYLAGGFTPAGVPTFLTGTIDSCDFDNNVSFGGAHSGSDLFVDSNATVDLNRSDFDDTLGLSTNLSTDLIDVGNTLSNGVIGVIFSSGTNFVWDNSWVAITNFGFAGSGDIGNDQGVVPGA
jgi:predicted outer membrane repeat protein